jgi:hypothetical protein
MPGAVESEGALSGLFNGFIIDIGFPLVFLHQGKPDSGGPPQARHVWLLIRIYSTSVSSPVNIASKYNPIYPDLFVRVYFPLWPTPHLLKNFQMDFDSAEGAPEADLKSLHELEVALKSLDQEEQMLLEMSQAASRRRLEAALVDGVRHEEDLMRYDAMEQQRIVERLRTNEEKEKIRMDSSAAQSLAEERELLLIDEQEAKIAKETAIAFSRKADFSNFVEGDVPAEDKEIQEKAMRDEEQSREAARMALSERYITLQLAKQKREARDQELHGLFLKEIEITNHIAVQSREDRLQHMKDEKERREKALAAMTEAEVAKLEVERQHIREEKLQKIENLKKARSDRLLLASLPVVQQTEMSAEVFTLSDTDAQFSEKLSEKFAETSGSICAHPASVDTLESALVAQEVVEVLPQPVVSVQPEAVPMPGIMRSPKKDILSHVRAPAMKKVSHQFRLKQRAKPKPIDKKVCGEIKKLAGDPDVWDALSKRLPTGKTAEDDRKRRALFKSMDTNGNGFLSLAEVERGIMWCLGSGIDDLFKAKPVLLRAFNAVKSISGTEYICFFWHNPLICRFRN